MISAERRRLGEPAPVVLLGAGASAEAGIGTMARAVRVHARQGPRGVRGAHRRDHRQRALPTCSPSSCRPRIRSRSPPAIGRWPHSARPPTSTSSSPPISIRCSMTRWSASGMRRRDYLLLINGVLRADRLQALIASRSPRVKVLKLHGDLFHRFMAWTPEEMETYLDEITTRVAPARSRCGIFSSSATACGTSVSGRSSSTPAGPCGT